MFSLIGWWKFRGPRVITCPENREPAAVEVRGPDVEHLDIRQCSRWPDRQGCGQECLRQIQAAPEDCLLRNLFTKWYRGQRCAYCGKVLHPVDCSEHKPALLGPGGRSFEWDEVRPDALARLMATHRPVCWNCHIAMSFRREHPELVVDRNFRH